MQQPSPHPSSSYHVSLIAVSVIKAVLRGRLLLEMKMTLQNLASMRPGLMKRQIPRDCKSSGSASTLISPALCCCFVVLPSHWLLRT